jgi:hypothetical protein
VLLLLMLLEWRGICKGFNLPCNCDKCATVIPCMIKTTHEGGGRPMTTRRTEGGGRPMMTRHTEGKGRPMTTRRGSGGSRVVGSKKGLCTVKSVDESHVQDEVLT